MKSGPDNSRLLDVLVHKSNNEAAKLLTKGRDGFCNSQVHMVSKAIPLWPTGHNIPALKPLRGVNDDVCGVLLCPPSYDWNDLSWVPITVPHVPGN